MHLFNNYITFHTKTKKAIKLNYCLLKCQRHAEYIKFFMVTTKIGKIF